MAYVAPPSVLQTTQLRIGNRPIQGQIQSGNMACGGARAGTNATATAFIVGNLVIIDIDKLDPAQPLPAVAGGVITFQLPASYPFPRDTFTSIQRIFVNNAGVASMVQIEANGLVTVYPTPNGGNFVINERCGWSEMFVSYIAAPP